jgi:hypothetical protein
VAALDRGARGRRYAAELPDKSAYDAYLSTKEGCRVRARTFDHASNPFSIPSPVYATQSAVPSLDQLNSSPTGC